MNEAELCKTLEEHYRDWEVYKEVPCAYGRTDLYVKKGCLWIAIEAKKHFNTKLIYQAYRTIPFAHQSYVAVPEIKDCYSAMEICRRLGIGVLMHEHKYHDSGPMIWREKVLPKFRRKITPLRVLDEMKLAVAGVQHNTMSEYKITIKNIVSHLEARGGRFKIKTLFEINHYHYSSSRSAHQCITRLCREGAIKEFEIDGDEFVISDTITDNK